MDESNYKGIDLNLLLVFAVLMRERSTTSAAKCLFISQSAVSQSLRRLRVIMNDDLFLRDRRGITPTPRAAALYRDILPSLNAIEDALKRPGGFDPRTSARHFKLRLMCTHGACIAPAILSEIQKHAPFVALSISAGPENGDVAVILQHETYDIVLSSDCIHAPQHSWLRHAQLPDVPLVCIYDAKRLKVAVPIGLDDYLTTPHVMPFLSAYRRTLVDEGLAGIGKKRRRTFITDDYSGIPFYLQTACALANFPLPAAVMFAKSCGLTVSPLPFRTEPYRTKIFWHGKNDDDESHRWLRKLVAEVITAVYAKSNDEGEAT